MPYGQFEDGKYLCANAFDANIYQLSDAYDGFDKIVLQWFLPNFPSESSTRIYGLVSENSAKFLREIKGWKFNHQVLDELGYTLTDGPVDLKGIQSFFVDLGWSTNREVKLLDSTVYLEVAEQGHCETCRRRISWVEESLDAKGIKRVSGYLHDRYPKDGKTLWIGIEVLQSVADLAGLRDFVAESFGVTVCSVSNVARRLGTNVASVEEKSKQSIA